MFGSHIYIMRRHVSFMQRVKSMPTVSVVSHGNSYSMTEMLHMSRHLKSRINNTKTIAYLMPNTVDSMVSLMACWSGQSNSIAVPLSPSLSVSELSYQIKDSRTETLLVHPHYLQQAQSLHSELQDVDIHVFSSDQMLIGSDDQRMLFHGLEETLKFQQMASLDQKDDSTADLMDPALMIYTSGTTGRPKGVLHTHSSLMSQMTSIAQCWQMSSKDTVLHCLPLQHVHGLVNALMTPLYCGGTVQFLTGGDSSEIQDPMHYSYYRPLWLWKAITAHQKITSLIVMAVPTMYSQLIDNFEKQTPESKNAIQDATSQVRLFISGSSALPDTVFQTWRKLFSHTILERYGMTETGMNLSNPLHGSRIPGCVGTPMPGVNVRIVNEDGDVVAGLNEQGELQVCGPNLFKEYFDNPQITAESWTPLKDSQRWFKTGDIVTRIPTQDGSETYKILGRASVDIIKTGGYKLSALEIESVIMNECQDWVRECSVVGITDPDGVYGERVAAVLSLKTSGTESSTLEKLRDVLKPVMAKYKIPSVVHVVSVIPRNTMGKVNKKQLRQIIESKVN